MFELSHTDAVNDEGFVRVVVEVMVPVHEVDVFDYRAEGDVRVAALVRVQDALDQDGLVQSISVA